MGTLGERIRTLFKEQGITIVSILTAVGMTIGVLIEALLGGPSATIWRMSFHLCMTCQAYLFPKLYLAMLRNTFDSPILLNHY